MSNKHHEYSPSSFPMRDKCIHFESDNSNTGDNSPAHRGTLQHEALQKIAEAGWSFDNVSKEDAQWILKTLSDAEFGNVEFASNRIQTLLEEHNIDDTKVRIEQKLVIFTTDMTCSEGTGDVVGIADDFVLVIDYKSGEERDYDPQMKTYALGAMQETGKSKALLIAMYGRNKYYTEQWYELDECQEFFDKMIGDIQNKENLPAIPCDYCSWCSSSVDCKARKKSVLNVKKLVLSDSKALLKGLSYKTDLTKLSPDRLGELMAFSALVVKWGEDMKSMIKEKLIKDEGSVEGYELKYRKSSDSIDATEARRIAVDVKEIDPVEFSKISSVTKTKLMKLLYGTESGKKVSKEDFAETFESAIQNSGKQTISVGKIK